jgi:hypothetical protein
MKGLTQRLHQSRYPLCQNSGVSDLFTGCRIHHADTTGLSRTALLVVDLSVWGGTTSIHFHFQERAVRFPTRYIPKPGDCFATIAFPGCSTTPLCAGIIDIREPL